MQFIPILLAILGCGIFTFSRIRTNIITSKSPVLPRYFKLIMDEAVEYEASQGEWPEDIFREIPALKKTTDNSFWIFSSKTYRDSLDVSTFLIKASLKKDMNSGEVPKGHFITYNSNGDLCYSHPLLHQKFMKAYLNNATYMGPDSLLSSFPNDKKQY